MALFACTMDYSKCKTLDTQVVFVMIVCSVLKCFVRELCFKKFCIKELLESDFFVHFVLADLPGFDWLIFNKSRDREWLSQPYIEREE